VARAADKEPKADPEPRPHFSYRADEPFDGKLRLNWKVIRPDATRASQTNNKCKKTITTTRSAPR
jgi:hypothetical protein